MLKSTRQILKKIINNEMKILKRILFLSLIINAILCLVYLVGVTKLDTVFSYHSSVLMQSMQESKVAENADSIERIYSKIKEFGLVLSCSAMVTNVFTFFYLLRRS